MGETAYKVSYYTIGTALRTVWRLHATGVHHVPDKGAAILASNHLSYLDSFFIPAVIRPRQVFFVSKVEHFDIPVQRWLFKQWGVIPLKRGEGDQEAFNRSVEVLREGHLYGIHPEGTRSTDGKLHRGRTGVARLALASGAPVIPIGIIGTDKILPKGKNVPTLDKAILHFGAPLTFPEFAGMENDRKITRDVTDRIMMAIRDLSGQEYVDSYHANPAYDRSKPAKE